MTATEFNIWLQGFNAAAHVRSQEELTRLMVGKAKTLNDDSRPPDEFFEYLLNPIGLHKPGKMVPVNLFPEQNQRSFTNQLPAQTDISNALSPWHLGWQ
jgi:hypothetical protein